MSIDLPAIGSMSEGDYLRVQLDAYREELRSAGILGVERFEIVKEIRKLLSVGNTRAAQALVNYHTSHEGR